MTIGNDWQVDYPNKFIYHIDGVISYGTGSGTQPSVGEYVRGATSGAVGKVIDRSGNVTTGTLTLTNVVGLFASGEALSIMSELDFDAVTAGNGGFKVGDTIAGNSSASTIVVKAIEYNYATAGGGTIYGAPMSAAFTNNEQLDISGGTADVADADGTGTDNDAKFAATSTSALAVPGTASTNNSVIVHYDGGTIDIPEGAQIQSSPTGAVGRVQKVYGATATGSVRVVNSDTTGGAWTNNDTLRILNCVYYDALVAGKVFSVGDRVQAFNVSLTGVEGRVIGVIDDGDDTGKLILMDKTAGTFNNTDELRVQQSDLTWVKYAEVENSMNAYLNAATLNLPGGVRSLQRPTQGGIYPTGSLNIVRASSDFYGWVFDTFDELAQLDDLFPIKANVRDQLYTLINGWQMYDLSFRFLERGAWQDSGKNNIWTNLQSISVLADVGDHGFFYDTTNPTPRPQLYAEQDETVLSTWWLEGHIDVLVKNKTSTDPRYINPAVPTLGQLIDDGNVTIHAREYRRTYFWVTSSTVGGQSPVAFNTIVDTNNTTGTHRITYTGTGGFTVGEEITCSGSAAVGIVTAESLAGDTLDIVFKTPTVAFSGTITGGASAATCTYSSIANLVAGYSSDVRVITVDRKFTGGTLVGTPVYGEIFVQATSGYQGYYMGKDTTVDLWFDDANASAPGTQELTGAVSGATYTPSGNSTQSSLNYDLEDGSGLEAYSGLIATDITGADAQAIADVYEYCKYLTASESTSMLGGPGTSDAGLAGKIYKALASTYAVDTQGCPIGHFAGGKLFGARGWFIVKEDLAAADIQSFNLINNTGTTRIPPNLQNMTMADANLDAVRVAAYRTAVENSTTIQRTEFQVGTVGSGFNQAADTAIKLAAQDRAVPMPADVPSVGIVYVLDPNDTGNYLEFPYNAVNRTTGAFTLTSGSIGDVTGAVDLTTADNAHVAFLREQVSGTSTSRSIQYVADIYVFWVARKKGFLDAKGTTVFGSTGASIACNLQADENVTLP